VLETAGKSKYLRIMQSIDDVKNSEQRRIIKQFQDGIELVMNNMRLKSKKMKIIDDSQRNCLARIL